MRGWKLIAVIPSGGSLLAGSSMWERYEEKGVAAHQLRLFPPPFGGGAWGGGAWLRNVSGYSPSCFGVFGGPLKRG